MSDGPIFATRVEVSNTRTTSSGRPFIERGIYEPYDYRSLEDQQRFHDVCEVLRLKMIEALRSGEPGPINRWRLGTVSITPGPEESLLVGVRSRALSEGTEETR